MFEGPGSNWNFSKHLTPGGLCFVSFHIWKQGLSSAHAGNAFGVVYLSR